MIENTLNFDETVKVIEDELLQIFREVGGCESNIFDECFPELKSDFMTHIKDQSNLIYVSGNFDNLTSWQIRNKVNTENDIFDVLGNDLMAIMAEDNDCIKSFFEVKNAA